MSSLIIFALFCQALGAFIGAGAAIWGEFSYLYHARRGRIDRAEQAHLRAIGRGLSFGMTLLLISSFAVVTLAYLENASTSYLLSVSYWVLIAIALIVLGASWALSRGRIPLALASAIILTGWWVLTYLTFGWISFVSFTAAIAFFMIATALFYAAIAYARMLVRPRG